MKTKLTLFILAVITTTLEGEPHSLGNISFDVPNVFSVTTDSLAIEGYTVQSKSIFDSTGIFCVVAVIDTDDSPSSSYSNLSNTYVSYEQLGDILKGLAPSLLLGYLQGYISGTPLNIGEFTLPVFESNFTTYNNVFGVSGSTTITDGYDNYNLPENFNLYIFLGFDGKNVIIATLQISQSASSQNITLVNNMLSTFQSDYISNPLSDNDGDGLSNRDELILHRTNPNLTDSNSNGLTDFEDFQLRTGTSLSDLGFMESSNVSNSITDARNEGINSVLSSPNSYGLHNLNEIVDLKPDLELIRIDNEEMSLNMKVQESTDFVNWTDSHSSTMNISIDNSIGKKFYRAALSGTSDINLITNSETFESDNYGYTLASNSDGNLYIFENNLQLLRGNGGPFPATQKPNYTMIGVELYDGMWHLVAQSDLDNSDFFIWVFNFDGSYSYNSGQTPATNYTAGQYLNQNL